MEHFIRHKHPPQRQAPSGQARSGPTLHAHPVALLQGLVGNRAVAGMLQAAPSPRGRRPEPAPPAEGTPARSPGGVTAGGALPEILRQAVRSPGRKLSPATRSFMESVFAADFGNVRLHAGTAAAESASALHARAYTVGEHVVMGGDRAARETTAGRRLLAHELAHVLQQRRGGRTPTGRFSGAHEQEADAAAGAVAAGHPAVAVRRGTGIGLARQPSSKSTEADLQVEKLLRLPAISDPRSSPRYIDKLFQSVTYSWFNGASVFHWKENGKDREAGVALADLEQDDTLSFVPILDVHGSREEAFKVVRQYASNTTRFKFYTFYRTGGDVIMPTSFSVHSTPEFHKLWPGLKKGIAEDAAEIRRGLASLANMINPLPGTKVDTSGKMSVSGDPLDWLGLLKLRRQTRMREAGPITRKRHSGYGVPYTVVGPHDRLSGTSVYILKDADGAILYVGKGDALSRLREHIKDPKKTQWFGEIRQIEVRATGLSNTQALALEENLINQLKPMHNVDRHPFQKEFGNTMDMGANLPKAQKGFLFWLEWGHREK